MYSKLEIIQMILNQMPGIISDSIINRLLKLDDHDLNIMFEKSTYGAKLERLHNNYIIKY